jgi:hypothetical protein
MGKRAKADDTSRRLDDAAKAERRLLKRERRAEREVVELRAALQKDEARLRRAEDRVERRRGELAAAEARLTERQAERASGPAAPAAPTAGDHRPDVAAPAR